MKKLYLLLLFGFAGIFLSGCFGVDSNFRSIRNVTLNEYGNDFVVDTEFALGSFELWIAEGIVSLAEEGDLAADLLDNISGVQVGIYKRKSHSTLATKEILKKIDRKMERRGWKYVVKQYSRDEVNVVYINKNANKMLHELFVVVIENQEMTIVQVSGDLEKVIEVAIREGGLNINQYEEIASN